MVRHSRWATCVLSAGLLGPAGPAGAEIEGGAFADGGLDTTPRFFHAASVLPDGHVLISGGMRLNLVPLTLVSLEAISFFDPATDTCSAVYQPTGGGSPTTPSLSTARSSHTQTTLLDGRVLITGGNTGANGTNPGTPVASVEIFDPRTGAVSGGPAMSTPRHGHTASLLPDGRVVVAGGGTWEVFVPGDPDTWSAGFTLERSRTHHAAVTLPDHAGAGAHRVLLMGGSGTGPATLELLDPDGGGSALAASTLDVGVDDLAAVRMADGRVLIVGGQNLQSGDTVGLSYCYDPLGDVIAPTAAPPGLANGLADHRLVGLGEYALVVGGEQQVAGVDTELDYAALYDASAGQWIFTAQMSSAHDDAAAVRLDDGRVLVIDGGLPFAGGELPSAATELFTPQVVEPADLNCDGAVNTADLLELLGAWGACPAPCPPACPADLNGDCIVATADLLALIAAWG